MLENGFQPANRQGRTKLPFFRELMIMRLILYQPDIPQNAGTLMRLAACFGIAIDIIEPCGFVLDDRRLRRAGMDYLETLERHTWPGWNRYIASRHRGRLVLLTTKGERPYIDFPFRSEDRLLVGQESAGVPPEVHTAADSRLVIPMRTGARSLNVAQAAAMVVGEALRQTGGFA